MMIKSIIDEIYEEEINMNNMIKLSIELTENDLNNIYAFLDRVAYKGIQEIDAFNSISNALRRAKVMKVDEEDKIRPNDGQLNK